MGMERRIWLTCILIALAQPASSITEASMAVTPIDGKTVLLQGDEVKDMTSVEITFDWNTTLGDPQVSVQGGNVTAMVTNANGGMTVKVNRDDPDAVLEVELGFEKSGDMSRAISNVAVKAMDAQGASYPFPVKFDAPENPPVWEPPKEQAPSPVEAPATGRSDKQGLDKSPREAEGGIVRTEQTHAPGGIASEARAAHDGAPLVTTPADPGEVNDRLSVLQRFREYRGKKGFREFTALFARKGEGIRQEPSVAIADGKTPVRISLELEPRDGYAPNFALSDARFLSLHNDGEKSWVMTVVPNEGAWEVRLLLRTGKDKIEFPLIVAPPVKIPIGINEKNFLVELDQYLADQAALRAANSDPSRQYLQEYIFTANYLANLTKTP